MPNYTKLFNSIVTSTIWTEDDKTRIVWITMLALSDQNGEVHSSIPGLARLSAIPIPDVERALEKFLSPDPYSRTPDNDGRRIAKIDGGWELLNHAKYRKMASKEDSKAASAERVRRHRQRNACNANVTNVTPCNGFETVGRDIAEAEAEANTEAEVKVIPKKHTRPESPFEFIAKSVWNASPPMAKQRSSKKDLVAAIKASPELPSLAGILKSLETWKNSADWKKDNGQFIPGIHLWIKKAKWEIEPIAERSGTRPLF